LLVVSMYIFLFYFTFNLRELVLHRKTDARESTIF